MNAISAQYSLMTLLATAKNTCSGGLAAGPTPAASQVFPMTPTSSPAARPASPSASRDDREASRTTVTSGRKWLDLLHRSDPLMSLSKTLLTSSAWRSTECSLTWRARATAQGRLLFQLVPSMRPTGETDCGSLRKLWTTPTTPSGGQTVPEGTSVTGRRPDGSKATVTLANEAAMVADLWQTPTVDDAKNSTAPPSQWRRRNHGLAVQAARDQALWSTPRASDGEKGGPNQAFGAGGQPLPAQAAQALWPTPIANDAEKRGVPKVGAGLAGAVHPGPTRDGSPDATAKPAGSLNPEFVCWLQGYPPEWLSCAPSEMPSAHRRQPKSSKP
jgi:hypothetical protein